GPHVVRLSLVVCAGGRAGRYGRGTWRTHRLEQVTACHWHPGAHCALVSAIRHPWRVADALVPHDRSAPQGGDWPFRLSGWRVLPHARYSVLAALRVLCHPTDVRAARAAPGDARGETAERSRVGSRHPHTLHRGIVHAQRAGVLARPA